MATNKSALIHAGLAHRTGVLSWPQKSQTPFFCSHAHTNAPQCAAAVTWITIRQFYAQQSADGAVGLGGLLSECVGKRCPKLLKRSNGGQRTSAPVEYPDLDQMLGGHAAVVSSDRTFISESRELLRLISCGRGGATIHTQLTTNTGQRAK